MASRRYATAEQTAALGTSVLAVRVSGGKVPEACVGVSLDGSLRQNFLAAQKATEPRAGALWWVRPGTYELFFAPVASAPEAGVRLVIELPLTGGLVSELLAHHLASLRGESWTLDDLLGMLLGHHLLHLPPCCQPEELQQIAREVGSMLVARGLRLRDLQRVDLHPEVDCAAMMRNLAKVDTTPIVEPASVPLAAKPDAVAAQPAGAPVTPAQLEASPPTETPATARAETLAEAIAQDETFGRRLFLELPRLADQLRAVPMPREPETFAAHRRLIACLERLARSTNRLPGLVNQINPRQIPESTVRLLAAESRHAAEGLDEAWAILAEDAPVPTDPLVQQRLARVLAVIEQAVFKRTTPWWEIK
jgi:hypothetical protein